MGEKSRVRFIVIIALILAAAVVYSFTVGAFQETPDVGFADPAPTGGGETTNPPPFGNMVPVSVEPDTVQSVIRTLERYTSYRRTLSVEYLSGGTVTGTLSVAVAVDSGWTRCDVTESNGRTEHTVLGGASRWLWYDDETDYVQVRTDESAADLIQRVPTYEDVLAVEAEDITAAGYERRGGLPCIFVEVRQSELDYLERFWVSVESGLLVAAETEKDGAAVYRMSSYQVECPLTDAGESFTLPDGEVLHRPEG